VKSSTNHSKKLNPQDLTIFDKKFQRCKPNNFFFKSIEIKRKKLQKKRGDKTPL